MPDQKCKKEKERGSSGTVLPTETKSIVGCSKRGTTKPSSLVRDCPFLYGSNNDGDMPSIALPIFQEVTHDGGSIALPEHVTQRGTKSPEKSD